MSIAAAPDPARPEGADTFAWVSPAHDRRQLAHPREPEIASRDRKFVARLQSRRIYSLPYRRSIAQVIGFRSKAAMTWCAATEAVLGEHHRPAANVAVPVRVRQLGGNVVWLRPRSRDRAALEFLNLGHHLPPAELTGPVRRAAIFGANIGLLLADLASRYPQARLLGVEADHDNAILARRNLARLGDRCTVEEAAVWHRDETLTVDWVPDAWGQMVAERDGPDSRDSPGAGGGTHHIRAVEAGNLLTRFAAPLPVDYLLVNIESAWYEMLQHGQWTENVRCIKVEIQDHYDEAVPLLEALGYRARLQRVGWGAFAIGIRPAP
jgi:FkbM family methyltransferase